MNGFEEMAHWIVDASLRSSAASAVLVNTLTFSVAMIRGVVDNTRRVEGVVDNTRRFENTRH